MSETPTAPQASDDASSVVACRDVTREYTRGRGGWFSRADDRPTVVAVADLSLEIQRGEVVAVAGPSGSGKSTLLHLLAALDVPTGGEVRLAGQRTGDLSARQRARLRLDHVGIVFQQFHLLPSLSAVSNVALPLVEHGLSKADRRERATALLERLGLGGRLGHRPNALSGGEQQRVALARALIAEPDLLIADEPTGELDSETSEQVLDLIRELGTGRAVVLASHDQQALDRADRQISLRDGRRTNA